MMERIERPWRRTVHRAVFIEETGGPAGIVWRAGPSVFPVTRLDQLDVDVRLRLREGGDQLAVGLELRRIAEDQEADRARASLLRVPAARAGGEERDNGDQCGGEAEILHGPD